MLVYLSVCLSVCLVTISISLIISYHRRHGDFPPDAAISVLAAKDATSGAALSPNDAAMGAVLTPGGAARRRRIRYRRRATNE